MSALPEAVAVKKDGLRALFSTPNDTCMGRAQTLFTKEPVTIRWLESMYPGDVLWDIGANVGSYTVWGGKLGLKVVAFEPEAQNYNLLCQNIALNQLEVDAYCIALSDKVSVSQLHLSEKRLGTSCHSFGKAVGPRLEPREGPTQGCVAFTVDKLVKSGLPAPNHIKVDVDGFEHKVIVGAEKTLKSDGMKSVLIEINREMKEHQDIIDWFLKRGWYVDWSQVEDSTRKGGVFKGYAEHVFHRLAPVAKFTLERIRQAHVHTDPFPYIYVEDVFDPRMYQAIRQNVPPIEKFEEIGAARNVTGYPDRFVMHPKNRLWNDLYNFMLCGALRDVFFEKFGVSGTKQESFLMKDRAGYAIGPHTDSPQKVLSALFYLPPDDSLSKHGTSVYKPKDPAFTCPGTTHHGFEGFEKVATMPFKPNSLFAFPKSERSFHGVETFDGEGYRDLLLYDIKR